MLSDKAKIILKRSKGGMDNITVGEAREVLTEVTSAMKEKNSLTDPDYFTLAFIQTGLIVKVNGKHIKRKK